MTSNIIKTAIAHAIYKHSADVGVKTPAHIIEYAASRWGRDGAVTKALVNPIVAVGSGLVNETLVRDEFVQAVFSGSILGKLNGLVEVPAMTRVNVESTPVTAPFVGEHAMIPAYQGNFGFAAVDVRKVAITTVVTEELLRMTGNAAESFISGQLQRALSRGIDAAFVGSQARDAVSPNGLGAPGVSTTSANFYAGVASFQGDLSKASVIVNPRTAATLRSPTEQLITASGGFYGGLPVITSYAVPVGLLWIVDGSRVLAYIGAATVNMSSESLVMLDDGTGGTPGTVVGLFQEMKRALAAVQYVDFEFVPGAAVSVTVATS